MQQYLLMTPHKLFLMDCIIYKYIILYIKDKEEEEAKNEGAASNAASPKLSYLPKVQLSAPLSLAHGEVALLAPP